MGVKSARVQQGVVGDDIVFQHTIVKPAVTGNTEGVALVVVNEGDTAVGFYASEQNPDPSQPSVPDVQSTAVPGTGASAYAFPIPKAASVNMLPGLTQTVRIEITRADASKETYYLFDEYDLLDRGFPSEPPQLNLP